MGEFMLQSECLNLLISADFNDQTTALSKIAAGEVIFENGMWLYMGNMEYNPAQSNLLAEISNEVFFRTMQPELKQNAIKALVKLMKTMKLDISYWV